MEGGARRHQFTVHHKVSFTHRLWYCLSWALATVLIYRSRWKDALNKRPKPKISASSVYHHFDIIGFVFFSRMTTFTRWKHHSVCPKQRNEHGLHLKSCSFLSFSIQKHQARQIPCIYCYLIAAWHYRNDISAHNLNSNALNVRCVSSIIEYNRDFSYRTSS